MPLLLAEWEDRLIEEVAGGDVLLGQLPLGEPPFNVDDMESLGVQLRDLFASMNFQAAVEFIEIKYPLSFALYLVLQGIYNYQGGDYWTSPGTHLQISEQSSYTYHCGIAFRRILKKFDLPTFNFIHGHRNLVPILAHGGIPNYSLNDFFRLLHRSTKNEIFTLDAETLIEQWSKNPENTFFFIDRPVERFLLHGGDVAEDFLTRCLSMIDANSDEEMKRLDLPLRVVDQYGAWLQGQTDQQLGKSRILLSRPYLYLDPYNGEGVCLALPPQVFPSSTVVGVLDWIVETEDGKRRNVLTERNRKFAGYEFAVPELITLPKSKRYQITLRKDETKLRTWDLAGLPNEQWMHFDPDTGSLLNEWARQQAGYRWILFPNEFDLEVENGRKTEELLQQYGDWGRFSIEAWVLDPGAIVSLIPLQGTACTLEISDSKVLQKPFLEGGTQPLDQQLRSKLPLYSGKPPNLVISFANQPSTTQLARWQVTISSDGLSRPADRRSTTLDNLKEWIVPLNETQIAVDLAAPVLLGEEPCGAFEIDAQGPYGRGRRLGLRIVPHLEVHGHHQLYLSGADGPALFHITCGSKNRIHTITTEGVHAHRLAGNGKRYEVMVESRVQAVKFAYVDHEEIRVPFSIRVRRLRWGLWQNNAPEEFTWQTTPLRIHPDVLEDIYGTSLYVDLPTIVGKSALYAGWRLIDSKDEMLSERPPNFSRSQQQFAIPFGEILPVYRNAQKKGESLSLQLWLCIQNNGIEESFVDAVTLVPTLEFGKIETSFAVDNSRLRLSLKVELEHPIQNLFLLLWPADQAWIDSPLSLGFEDSESGYQDWELDWVDLPGTQDYRGEYIGQIAVVDPWSGLDITRKSAAQENLLEFVPDNADAYYAAIKESQSDPIDVLTSLTHQFRTGQLESQYNPIAQLNALAKQSDLDFAMLVSLADLVREQNNPTLYKVLQWSICSESLIDRLEETPPMSGILNGFLEHIPDNKPDPMVYLRLLIAGYPQVRRLCITKLCHQRETIGIDELLDDVQIANITVHQAAEILEPVADFAAEYLLQVGSADALDLLSALAKLRGSSPTWIEVGFLAETKYGVGIVRQIEGGRMVGNLPYCQLDDNARLGLQMVPANNQLFADIDLLGKRISFMNDSLYQCSACNNVFVSHDAVLKHYETCHPYKKITFSQSSRTDFSFSELTAHFPSGEDYRGIAPNSNNR